MDAHVMLDDQMRFAVDVSLANADVAEFARSIHSQRHDISGKVFALVRLKGAKAGLAHAARDRPGAIARSQIFMNCP